MQANRKITIMLLLLKQVIYMALKFELQYYQQAQEVRIRHTGSNACVFSFNNSIFMLRKGARLANLREIK